MEPIIGTPAVVGFGNGFNNGDLNLGLSSLLLAQRQGADFCDISRDVHVNSALNHVAIEKNGAANQVAIVENAHNIEIAVEKTAAAGLLATKVSELATANQFGIAALSAAANTAALQAAIAACCCDTKALIIEKANSTDALIRQIEESRVRDLLSDAKFEIAALKASGHNPQT